MSDITTDTSTGDSGANTTAEITSQVIESLESADAAESSETGESVESPDRSATADTTTTEAPPPAPAVVVSPEDAEVEALLAEFGFKELRKPDGREHYIPRSKVLKMIGSGLKRGQEKWTTERGVFEGQVGEMRGQLADLQRGVSGDPKAFIAELASIDPRYQAFLEPAPAARPQALDAAADDPMPQPDYELGDGSRTYTVQGLQKRDEWIERQLMRKLDGRLDERLKPFSEREKAEKERAEHAKAMEAVSERTRGQMQEAQKWPLFGPLATDGTLNEVQAAVLAELQRDTAEAKAAGRKPSLSLEGAYIRVTGPRFAEDDKAKRARILKELKDAPTAPALARQTTDSGRPAGPRSTADIARQVVTQAERGA